MWRERQSVSSLHNNLDAQTLLSLNIWEHLINYHSLPTTGPHMMMIVNAGCILPGCKRQ